MSSPHAVFKGNYYVVMPSAHMFAITLGARSSLSPTLIGVTNISSILSCLIQVLYISKRNSFVKQHTEVADYRLPLIISALCPLVGNIIYSYALAYPSVVIALIGRLLIGFGCAEVVNRRLLLVTLPPESINIEVARLVKVRHCHLPSPISYYKQAYIHHQACFFTPQSIAEEMFYFPSNKPIFRGIV